MKNNVRVTVHQYPVENFYNWESYEKKIRLLIADAKKNNSDLVMFGEYAALELVAQNDFASLQNLHARYISFYQTLAHENEIYIQPGTFLFREQDGTYRNRAYFFGKNKQFGFQDKIFLTPFEKTSKLLQGGSKLKIFQTEFGKIAIAICYDSEFPIISQVFLQHDVKLILVPSCTSTLTGSTRVNICSRARAIENQCYVAQSCLVGFAATDQCEFIDENVGVAAIYSPADVGFPNDGIVAKGTLNQVEAVHADLSFEKLANIQINGEVRNRLDLLDFSPSYSWKITTCEETI